MFAIDHKTEASGTLGPSAAAWPIHGRLAARAAAVEGDLHLAISSRFDPNQLGREAYDGVCDRLAGNARLCHVWLWDRLLGPLYDPALLALTRPCQVLEVTARADPAGALDLAEQMKFRIDSELAAYDQVTDKQAFFESVSPMHAQMITRLFRTRRQAQALIETLRPHGAVARMPKRSQ
ncbi:MAG TPA: hypothetical protein PLP01_03750 [Phycisphaerae bacterium]|nr:hypothetical protein [Phycisphaerae bacterium]HOI54339.1 hypothetical protein [Phycisphaerae bacterium]